MGLRPIKTNVFRAPQALEVYPCREAPFLSKRVRCVSRYLKDTAGLIISKERPPETLSSCFHPGVSGHFSGSHALMQLKNVVKSNPEPNDIHDGWTHTNTSEKEGNMSDNAFPTNVSLRKTSLMLSLSVRFWIAVIKTWSSCIYLHICPFHMTLFSINSSLIVPVTHTKGHYNDKRQ